jgi:uncharacterized protein (TIGR02246 family)
MHRRTLRPLVPALTALLGACAVAPSADRLDDVAAIGALHRRDADAAKAKDLAALAATYTEDAVSLPPDRPPLLGRAAILADMQAHTLALEKVEIVDYRFVWHDLEIDGDHAYAWGWIVGRLWTPDNKQVDVRYKALRVLRRGEDGAWRVHRTMWNAAPNTPK